MNPELESESMLNESIVVDFIRMVIFRMELPADNTLNCIPVIFPATIPDDINSDERHR